MESIMILVKINLLLLVYIEFMQKELQKVKIVVQWVKFNLIVMDISTLELKNGMSHGRKDGEWFDRLPVRLFPEWCVDGPAMEHEPRRDGRTRWKNRVFGLNFKPFRIWDWFRIKTPRFSCLVMDGRSFGRGKSGHRRAGSPIERSEAPDHIPVSGLKCHRKQTAGGNVGKGERVR